MVAFLPEETVKCPSCKKYYRRLVIDNAIKTCPRCLNSKHLKDENNDNN